MTFYFFVVVSSYERMLRNVETENLRGNISVVNKHILGGWLDYEFNEIFPGNF